VKLICDGAKPGIGASPASASRSYRLARDCRMVILPRLHPQRGHLDHAVDHASSEELRLHPARVVQVECHPTEVSLPHQTRMRRRRLSVRHFEVAGELKGAEIGVTEILTLCRSTRRHFQMFLHGFRRIGTALRRPFDLTLDEIGNVFEQGRGAVLAVLIDMQREPFRRGARASRRRPCRQGISILPHCAESIRSEWD
jgi:hypothetical protein